MRGRANHCMLFFTNICAAVQSIDRARSIARWTPPPIDMWAPSRIRLAISNGGNRRGNPQLCGELLVDQALQVRRDRWLIEALDHFVEKTGHDKALGRLARDAAGTRIEKFVFIDLAARGAVSAPDVVGQNLETGDGIGLGVVAQK